MQRRKRLALAAVPVVGALALLAPTVLAGPDASATVRFGNDDVGSPFAPITEHDNSGNGKFNLIPRTVTIAEGGSVTYDILIRFGIHQPAVYEPGTTPDDIVIQDHSRLSTTPLAELHSDPSCPPQPAPTPGRPQPGRSTNRGATSSCATSRPTLRSSTCTAG